jgi:hypothetical protein
LALLGLLSSAPAQAADPAGSAAAANNATTITDFVIERPTLVSIGFVWKIKGDDNRNAKAEVQYRKKGDTQWKDALPLFRSQNEKIGQPAPGSGGYAYNTVMTAPNHFAGSIFNLEPGTTYEAKLTLTDPDGVIGESSKIATVTTRTEPMQPVGGKVYHVYPPGFTGVKQEPSFPSLMAAYNTGSNAADNIDTFVPRVRPGDTIIVHAGLYKDCGEVYGGCVRRGGQGTEFDNTYYLTASGTPDKPIYIKAAGDGDVIFDGNGNAVLFDLMAANYNVFDGITVRNTDIAFLIGRKNIGGSSGFGLKHSKIEKVARGVYGTWSGSKDMYIADNVFVGRRDPNVLVSWIAPDLFGKIPGYPETINGPKGAEFAIKMYGQGHVVAYNRVVAFHDGIDIATYGAPDGDPDWIEDRFPASIDVYGNDVTNAGDNCFETDGGARNIRVFRNRCFNSANPPLSAQPALGGPVYIIQNLIYNSPTGSTKFTSSSSGMLVYQNTIIGENAAWGPFSNIHYLNNLILAQGAEPEWKPRPYTPTPPLNEVDTFTSYSSSDYNGFRPNPGAPISFSWTGPAKGITVDYSNDRPIQSFKTLKEYAKATGHDTHSILIDYSDFVKASIPDRSNISRIYKPEEFDFHLKPTSKAVDHGVVLPNINDDFTGKAPDLGVYETGKPIPHYGPRD